MIDLLFYMVDRKYDGNFSLSVARKRLFKMKERYLAEKLPKAVISFTDLIGNFIEISSEKA